LFDFQKERSFFLFIRLFSNNHSHKDSLISFVTLHLIKLILDFYLREGLFGKNINKKTETYWKERRKYS